jgi:hypothetical protein
VKLWSMYPLPIDIMVFVAQECKREVPDSRMDEISLLQSCDYGVSSTGRDSDQLSHGIMHALRVRFPKVRSVGVVVT